MDLLTGKIKPMYFKYLTAAFGSALISSIYGVVDMAMVGQYQGPEGTAALAVITWLAIVFFDRELLLLFGAEETLLPLARRYLFPVKFAVPSFLFTQLMAAFLRNDGNPGLATKAVLFGGIFNVFGDYFFVFILQMGIMGAGLATAMGSVFSLLVMLTHFCSKKNTLRFVKPSRLFHILKSICVTGFSTFFIDVAMGILTMLFNRQILKYLGTDALSVYGIIINISTFVQCCAYSIGQASQPMISTNFGAGKGGRIVQILKYALGTAAVFGMIWTSFAVSVSRGVVISGILILILPVAMGANAIWFAMPITELLVAIYVAMRMIRYTKAINEKERQVE